MHWEARFDRIAETREGLVAKFHLPPEGLDSRHWWRAVRTGRWIPVGARVLRAGAAPTSDTQRVLAAVLDASPGAVLHESAALAWLGMEEFNLARLKVARARGLTSAETPLAEVHRLRTLRPEDVIVLRGVPTETALRAIWAFAERFSAEPLFDLGVKRIGDLLDAAHRLGLVRWSALHQSVDDLQARGRAGTVLMRELAVKRQPGSSPTESKLETRFEEVLAEGGVDPFRRQCELGGRVPIGRFDFADPALPLAVEVNSLTFHTTPSDRAADERRYLAMLDAGFCVAVIWEPDLWRRTTGVVETVRDARRRARRGERVVLHSPGCPWPPALLGTPTCS